MSRYCMHATRIGHKRGKKETDGEPRSCFFECKKDTTNWAWKAPAIAPQVTKSLLFMSFLKYLSHFQVSLYFREPTCLSELVMQAPICTIGPCLPTTKPIVTQKLNQKSDTSGHFLVMDYHLTTFTYQLTKINKCS